MALPLRLTTALLVVLTFAFSACVDVFDWGRGTGPPPAADPTPHPNCSAFAPTSGVVFVQFSADVTRERASEIITEVGAQESDYLEANMSPLALPVPDPGPDGYFRMTMVPAGEEADFIALFVAYSEVVMAVGDWPLCIPR